MNYQVAILGGGITGSFLGKELAEEGLKVCIIERSQNAGKSSCSGVVSDKIHDFISTAGFEENRLEGLEVNLPKSKFSLKSETIVLNRDKLDPELLKKASESGSEVLSGTEALDIKIKNNVVLKTSDGKIKSGIFVDCSGVSSFLPRKMNLSGNKEMYSSALTRIEYRDESKDKSEIYLNRRYSKEFFAWKIPREEKIEYGVITKGNAINSLKEFLKDRERSESKILNHPIQTGSQKSVTERALALGESACQVKPLSGGGIIYGLKCSHIAKKAILKSIEMDKFDENFLEREYEDKCREEIGDGIRLQRKLKKALYGNDFKELYFPEVEIDVDYDFLG